MEREKGNMKVIVADTLLIIMAILCISLGFCYNQIVSGRQTIQDSCSCIDAQLQQRLELLPNLLGSARGCMEQETAVIESITKSREKLMSADTLESKLEANEELTEALNYFDVVAENYPELMENSSFIQLQEELEGAENRISEARKDYNDAAGRYNQMINEFPGVIIASLFGYEPAEYYLEQG